MSRFYPQIADPENLRLAFQKAARGKWERLEVAEFSDRLDENLTRLRSGLIDFEIEVGDYHFFTIYDPKERRICAAAFRERVLHHAIMNICEPVFERAAIFDSYACRPGRGRIAALHRAGKFHRRGLHCLKLDVRRFFDSVPHEILLERLARKFKDPALEWLFRRILSSYETMSGRGLPIGSLTSQHCANFYLGFLDRFVKEQLQVRRYVRYMDDFLLWHVDRGRLKDYQRRIEQFLREELGLDLKEQRPLQKTERGVNFLGFRLFPWALRLSQQTKSRARKKIAGLNQAFETKMIDEVEYARRSGSLFAFLAEADSLALRRAMVRRGAVTR